jgi:hypothetical protein
MFLRSPISSLTFFCVAALLRPKPKMTFESSDESCFRNSNWGVICVRLVDCCGLHGHLHPFPGTHR